jgi:hypothetical protein
MAMVLNKPKKNMGLLSLLINFVSAKQFSGNKDISMALIALPDNFFIINDVNINNATIDHVVICPKGIFAIEDGSIHFGSNYSIQPGQEKYRPIKRAIQNSKALNDFMQNCKIGNFFVNTLLISDSWHEKLKTYFPDIPVINTSELKTHFQSLEDKYSDAQCMKIADLLELNLRIETSIKQLRKDKPAGELK